jgi:integrase
VHFAGGVGQRPSVRHNNGVPCRILGHGPSQWAPEVAQIVRRQSKNGEPRYDVRTRVGGRVVTKTFRRRRDADAYAATLEAGRLRGLVLDPREARLTVETVARRWLASNPAKRPTTLVADDLALRQYVLPGLGNRPVGSVTPGDVQSLVNEWSARIAPRTVRRHYGVLRAVLAFAAENDWIGRSSCRGVKLPAVTTTRRFSLSPDHIAAIAKAMPPVHRPVLWLGTLLGLRWSEVAGLRVGRIDWAAGRLRVEEAVTRGPGGRLVHGPPKSRAGRRRLIVPTALMRILAAHLGGRGLTPSDTDELLFTDAAGGPLSYSHWRQRVWLPACRAAGCEGAGFHDLRRANATGMVAEGVDVKVAQRRLGHADVRMTLDIYAEALETSERRAAEALAARFLPPSADSTPPNGPHRTLADEDGDQGNTVRRARWTRDGDQDPQPVDGRPTG